MKDVTCYCDRRGRIKFASELPDGMLLIASGNSRQLHDALDALARWSYPSKPGKGDSIPLVPGVPEAENELKAVHAVQLFRIRVQSKLNFAIEALDRAINNPNNRPEPLALAILRNDLGNAIVLALEVDLTLSKLDEARRFVSTHATGFEIAAVLKNWGRKERNDERDRTSADSPRRGGRRDRAGRQ
jgi:hypothetical protein